MIRVLIGNADDQGSFAALRVGRGAGGRVVVRRGSDGGRRHVMGLIRGGGGGRRGGRRMRRSRDGSRVGDAGDGLADGAAD